MGWPLRVSCWLPSLPLMAKDAGLPVLPSMAQCTGVAALPPGSASVRVTPVALPLPVLLTVTVKPMAVPAETLVASAVLLTWIDGQSTVSEAECWSLPSLPDVALAVLLYVAQLVLVVAAVTWTLMLTPPSRLTGWPAGMSCWPPSLPVIEKALGLPVLLSITQCTGAPALPPGSASLRLTPVAVPVRVLLTVTVKPIAVPAETLAASDVLLTWITGGAMVP